MAKRAKRFSANAVFSHWYTPIDGMTASPADFYKAVEAKIAEHRIPDLQTREIAISEGGLLSAKRIYLRVMRQGKIFDICAAPFGSGFFVSWWLGDKPPGALRQLAAYIALLPIIGIPFRSVIVRTYYQVDSMLIFQEAMHSILTATVDGLIEAQGLRPLTELQKKPIMNLD